MLSENQIFQAKVFLRSYKDAILCIEQTVIKKVTNDHYEEMYSQATSLTDSKEPLKLFRFSK
jgi:hypothetical protein